MRYGLKFSICLLLESAELRRETDNEFLIGLLPFLGFEGGVCFSRGVSFPGRCLGLCLGIGLTGRTVGLIGFGIGCCRSLRSAYFFYFLSWSFNCSLGSTVVILGKISFCLSTVDRLTYLFFKFFSSSLRDFYTSIPPESDYSPPLRFADMPLINY